MKYANCIMEVVSRLFSAYVLLLWLEELALPAITEIFLGSRTLRWGSKIGMPSLLCHANFSRRLLPCSPLSYCAFLGSFVAPSQWMVFAVTPLPTLPHQSTIATVPQGCLTIAIFNESVSKCIKSTLRLWSSEISTYKRPLDSYACPDQRRGKRAKSTNIYTWILFSKAHAFFWEKAQSVPLVV